MQLILSPEEDALPQRVVYESVMQSQTSHLRQPPSYLLPSMLFLLGLKMSWRTRKDMGGCTHNLSKSFLFAKLITLILSLH